MHMEMMSCRLLLKLLSVAPTYQRTTVLSCAVLVERKARVALGRVEWEKMGKNNVCTAL